MTETTPQTNNPKSIPEDDPRVQMAAERTILAWVRTGLALMAFGFVIARFALVLQSLGIKSSPFLVAKATLIGVLLVCLGVATSAAAPRHYRSYFRRIKASPNRFAASSLTSMVAYGSAILGMALVVYLILVDVSNFRELFSLLK